MATTVKLQLFIIIQKHEKKGIFWKDYNQIYEIY